MKNTFGLGLAAALMFGVAGLSPAVAQVGYRSYAPIPATPPLTPFGYQVPYGYLQPDETLGTSPSYVVSTNPYAPGVAVELRCQYPNGWNSTDFRRELDGIPNGIDHRCPVGGPR